MDPDHHRRLHHRHEQPRLVAAQRRRRKALPDEMTRLAPTLLCIVGLCLLAATPAAGAKKKAAGKLEISKTVNLPIPDDGPGAGSINGILRSTIDAGKQFKGRRIRDV